MVSSPLCVPKEPIVHMRRHHFSLLRSFLQLPTASLCLGVGMQL